MTYTGAPDWSDPFVPDAQRDSLGGFNIPNGTATLTQLLEPNQGVYKRFAISVTVPSTCLVTCQINGGFGAIRAVYARYTVPAWAASFVLPSDGVLAEQVSVNLTFTPALSGGNGTLNASGLRSWLDGARFDGIMPAQGAFVANWIPTNGLSTVVAAPTSPQRILLSQANLPVYSATAGSVSGFLRGTFQGTVLSFATVIAGTAGGGGGQVLFPNGLLLDPGVALSTSMNGALTTLANGLVSYDIVQ